MPNFARGARLYSASAHFSRTSIFTETRTDVAQMMWADSARPRLSSSLMNRRKEHHATIACFRIEIVSTHAGQPIVVCPKCDEVVSPPEQLAEHFPRCSTDRRLSVLKRGPLYKKPGEHR